MANLLEILQDPNYVNANAATKAAIFDKFAPIDSNYASANSETQNAIRTKFGLSVSTTAPVAPQQRQNVGPEKGNMFTQSAEDIQYDPMSGMPLNTSSYGSAPTGLTATVGKALTTAAGVPVNYGMGVASIPLNVANMASKVTGIGQPSTTMSSMITGQKQTPITQQALNAQQQIVQGVNQQSYSPVTQVANFAGEVFNPITAAVPGVLGNAVTKVGAAVPALAKYAAPIAESLASSGFKTGIVPTNALEKLVNLGAKAVGGGTVGVATNKLINFDESVAVAGGIGAAVPMVVPPIAKGFATVAGKIVDLASGQAAKVEAGKIARKMGGDTLNEIRAANGAAPIDIDAAQAAYGIQNDVWQAFLDVVKGKDVKSVFSTLKTKQAQDQFDVLANMARGATEAEAKTSRNVSNETLNKLTTPMREENMLNANRGTVEILPLQTEAELARQAAAANVENVRRFSAAQPRAINPAPTNLATDANLMNLANRADQTATNAAAESLTQGQIAQNAEAKIADLASKGIQPLNINTVSNRLDTLANQVGTRADPVQVTVLTKLKGRLQDLAQKNGGVIDANDLYQLRKTGINDVIESELRSGGLDPSTQSQRIASLLGEIRPLVDDAIEKAGGKTWRNYLSTHAAGMKQIEQLEMADKLRTLFKTNKNAFVNMVEGGDTKAVQEIFGPGNYDIAVQMTEKIKPLLKIKDEITRDAKIEDQINNARRALGYKENSWAEKIPGFVGLETAVAKKLIQTIEGKINTKAMEVLVKGAESGKSMNEILNTLPATEKSKLLIILNSNEQWSPLLGAATAQSVNKNKLAREQQNQNALAR